MTVIAMTQEMGTLGKDVATGVARELNLKLQRHEIGDTVAERMGVDKSLIRRAREGKAGWFEKREYDSSSFALFTTQEVFELALQGNVLIRGWGAPSLLRRVKSIPCVRICAPLENRVKWLMERLGTDDPDLAREEIERSDNAHAARIQHNFGVNWTDPLQYHLVLNTGLVSVESCVAQIVHLSCVPEFQQTEASAAMLRNLALEARIRSALRDNPATVNVRITLDVDAGSVTLRGMVITEQEKELAADVASDVEGVQSVDNQLRVMR